MPLLTRCPHCQKSLRVPDHAAGKKIRCPVCSEVFTAEEDIPVAHPVELPEPQAVTVAPLPPPLPPPLPVVQPAPRDPRLPPPRPRERHQPQMKSPVPLILAIVGLVVLLAGGGIAAWLLLR